MSVLRKLRKQMRVVSNPRSTEAIGGYSVYFVGMGERRVDFQGWWKTHLDFYSMDASRFAQKVRVNGGREFVREENVVSLYADRVLYEELYESSRKFDDAWIVFRPGSGQNPLRRLLGRRGYALFRDDHQLIRARIKEVAMIASADAGQRFLAQAAFLQILAHFCQASLRDPSGSLRVIGPLAARGETKSAFKEKVLSILTTELSRDVSVDELAHQLGVSRSTLSHRFSSEMGETLAHLKQRLRIQRAQQLMSDPSSQLKEIAFEVGYDDPAYFSRLFSKFVGLTPSEYRNAIPRGQIIRPED